MSLRVTHDSCNIFDDDDQEQLEEEYVVEHTNCNRDEASNPFLRRANATGREGGEAPESERACNLEDTLRIM